MIKSVHQRWFAVPASAIAPLLARVWTGTADDLFPVDWVATRRDNPSGVPADALVPGVTRLSHGFLPFLFERADATTWRVRTPFGGWHGFDLVAENGGTRVVHTLAIDRLPLAARLLWRGFVQAGHDWALEAIFDRLAHVLAGGEFAREERTEQRSGPRVGLGPHGECEAFGALAHGQVPGPFPPTAPPTRPVRLAIAAWNRLPVVAQDRIRSAFEAHIT